MKTTFLLVSAAMMVATPAFAADFTGPRLEVKAGYDRLDAEATFDDGFDSISDNGKEDGLVFATELGFDVQMGEALVVGAYGGADISSIESCVDFDGDAICQEVGRTFTIGARAGFKTTPGALLYVKGGYSNTRFKVDFGDAEDEDSSASDTLNGFHLGGGLEIALGDNFYGKAEYVYTNYNDSDISEADFSASSDLARHQGLLGFGARF